MKRLKEMVLKRLWLRDTWVIAFLLGFLVLNYPFLGVFNKPALVIGIPLLYLYLQLGWLAFLFMAYFFSRAQERKHDDERRT
ncbi:hypothetical protein LPW11_17500 [Geomonas sp. RF6]|uniref:hypothetical protein n=1 Tax=Geomonas sp. RF6 TaxID=2897342 RepID=UPI001E650969|nr:hypothetical protein [Geomonas sp. RF6]UFS69678.1 hypothetical protein LPW11_17500 [Geomonas sp. RF6]